MVNLNPYLPSGHKEPPGSEFIVNKSWGPVNMSMVPGTS